MPKNLIPIETLRKLLRYEPETGKLYWLRRPGDKKFNKRWTGKEAFTAIDGQKYHVGRVLYERYLAHRVAWALYHGEWPKGQIDHINHNRTDNRITNLRVVTNAKNMQNLGINSRNTSGVTGVHKDKRYGVWYAKITVNGKTIHLGTFKTKKEAVAARRAAEVKYGFHRNHGK